MSVIDELHARKPMNREAGLIFAKGEVFEPDCKKIDSRDSELPLAIIPKNELPIAPSFVDLTGVKFGRMTVIGRSRDVNGKWVVKCQCGTYSIRTSKAIKNTKNSHDRCDECAYKVKMKERQYFKKYGSYNDFFREI